MVPLATHCHTHYHLHPFHFVLFKFKDLVTKQHPTNTHTHTHAHTYTHTHHSSMYFDEAGDLAHEFYCEERRRTRSGKVSWHMRKIVDHLRPQVVSPVLYSILWYTVVYCSILWCTVVYCGSLVPRPRPAFRRLQYRKAGRAWYLFSNEHDVIGKWRKFSE